MEQGLACSRNGLQTGTTCVSGCVCMEKLRCYKGEPGRH